MAQSENQPPSGPFSKISRPIKTIGRFLADFTSSLAEPFFPLFIIVFFSSPVLLLGVMEGLGSLMSSMGAGIDFITKGKKLNTGIPCISYFIGTISALFTLSTFSPTCALIGRMSQRFGDEKIRRSRESTGYLEESVKLKGRLPNPISIVSSVRDSESIGKIMGPVILLIFFGFFLSDPSIDILETFRQLAWFVIFSALIAVFLLLIAWLIDRKSKTPSPEGSAGNRLSFDPLIKSKQMRGFMAACLLLSLAAFSPFFFLLRIYSSMGLLFAILCYLSFSVSRSVFTPGVALVSSKYGGKSGLIIGILSFIFALICAICSPQSPLISVLSLALLGLTVSVLTAVPYACIRIGAKPEDVGVILDSYKVAAGIIGVPANLVAAALWGALIYQIPASFIFSLIVSGLALALLVFVLKE